jgi:acetyl-CoA synthetase
MEVSELFTLVKKSTGSFAKPQKIFIIPELPKTRSGKIMRRILKKIVSDEANDLGDTSTLSNQGVVDSLIDLLKKE